MAQTALPAAALVRPGQVPLVYLDANVLLPQYLRSVFLDLADAGLIRVYWGRQVLEEVGRNLVQSAFGKTARQAVRLLRTITQAFPDALVLGSEPLEPQFRPQHGSQGCPRRGGRVEIEPGSLCRSASRPGDEQYQASAAVGFRRHTGSIRTAGRLPRRAAGRPAASGDGAGGHAHALQETHGQSGRFPDDPGPRRLFHVCHGIGQALGIQGCLDAGRLSRYWLGSDVLR